MSNTTRPVHGGYPDTDAATAVKVQRVLLNLLDNDPWNAAARKIDQDDAFWDSLTPVGTVTPNSDLEADLR